MHELLTIYLPAAIVALLISSFFGRYTGYKNLLYVGIYCIVVPVLAAVVAGGIGRWSVVISNSAGLLLIGLVLWLSGRKREAVEDERVGGALAE
jgi:hypothetical protein